MSLGVIADFDIPSVPLKIPIILNVVSVISISVSVINSIVSPTERLFLSANSFEIKAT